MKSPCESCVRVRKPEECENKACGLWQRWFLKQWGEHHAYYLEQMERVRRKHELEK